MKKVIKQRFSKDKVRRVLQRCLKRRNGKHNGATSDKKRKAVNAHVAQIAMALGLELDYSKLGWQKPYHPFTHPNSPYKLK